MVDIEMIPGKNERRVVFSYAAVPGRSVALAGVFNDWDPNCSILTYSDKKSAYCAELLLSPGIYEYKLVVNGEWILDDGNPNFTSNDFGTLNSVIQVD